MRYLKWVALVCVIALALTGCAPAATTPPTGSSEGTPTVPGGETTEQSKTFTIGKTVVSLDPGDPYDPSKIEFASMDGEPSRNAMFKPREPEGLKENIYPEFDSKTFKFLTITASGRPIAQRYYMFEKDGGTLNKALKGTGYKAATVYDSGDNKILPNFYTGYYDFAWTQTAHLPENWSGYESRQQELWKAGDNYVIIGASYNDENVLYAPAGVTSLDQLDGKTVGIMNPTYGLEATFNQMLSKAGLKTESAGGSVGIVMDNPGPILNNLLQGKIGAAFVRGTYKSQVEGQGFHEIASTSSEFGGRIPYAVLVVRRDILEKHPEVVQAVVQANYDATVKAKTDDEWSKKETELVLAFRTEYEGPSKGNVRPPKPEQLDAEANPAYFTAVYDYMKKFGFFKTVYPYDRLVDHSFYEKVKK